MSDLLIGMFWTKFGTSTGVADSGTVEEVDQFVAARNPAILYFCSRLVSPSKIDLTPREQLRECKDDTYNKALARDLLNQIRALKAKRRRKTTDKLEGAARLTTLIRAHREHNISRLKTFRITAS